jgi:tRNA pseudouridine38-40 synthase
MSQHNIKLVIAYDGESYLGWQKTSTGPTVEGLLEAAIKTAVGEDVVLQAASRTDAKVHAQGQVVNFFTSKTVDIPRFSLHLNALLPKDIVVLSTDLMPPSFHPTLDASGKEYHYHICQGMAQLPHYRLYSWHCPYLLDIQSMREAVKYLMGRHNFAALCNAKNQRPIKNYYREIKRIEIIELPYQRLRIEVEGINFLYKMVRNIVGLLVAVGRNKLNIETIQEIIEKKDRTLACATAPAHGLLLYKVNYEKLLD